MSFVQIENLSRQFGDLHAVKNISFEFDKGEIFGFIGPNGAGKSTTMRILATLDIPSSGSCRIDGLSSTDDALQLRRHIGYMPDSYGTYPNMTVEEYLDFFSRAYDLDEKTRVESLEHTIDFCQLDGLRDKLITTLSKGMKQRLCLGRCIVHNPDLLILDEPSAGLDPRARIEFRDLLTVLANNGKAIFVSSHILSELEEMCSSIAIIEQGELITTGKVRDIKANLRSRHTEDVQADTVIEIECAKEIDGLERILAEQPLIQQYEVYSKQATIFTKGNHDDQALILKYLIEQEVPIIHFAARDKNLEDIFLHVTEGNVQ